MQSLPPACLPVQELWDHVISLIGSRVDLSACSTTCRSLTPAAQSHLFYEVDLLWGASDMHFADVHPDRADPGVVARCDRLCTVLLRSPHLMPYIRSLSLSGTVELLTRVVAIQLPNLRKLHLGMYRGAPLAPQEEDTLARLAQKLVGLPSVERVSIWSVAQRVAFFATVFVGRSPQLRSISIECHTLVDSPTSIQPVAKRASLITELTLAGPAQLCDWLAHPGCGLDLSRLTYVEITEGVSHSFMTHTFSPKLQSTLYGAHRTIRQVRVDQTTVLDLDLNLFDRLTGLFIYTNDPTVGMPSVETALVRLNDQNNIERITLELEISAIAADTTPFHRVDASLAARRMTSLQQFVVCFVGGAVNRPEDEEGILRSYFPLMEARGLLAVSV
ncbi:hypothetical protein FB451DRAFT_1213257 [Mycena latifolia]|nr:hypothetical protein FB451DRAFT_1213257 [Mycena latifolia]